MSTLDFDRNLFEANASAANDWGSIGAGGGLEFSGNISARRGIDIDLGLMAIANLDASFSQYVAADLSGQAVAQASIRGQIQLPLNLFDEVGLAVRLQAIAELAAGIRLGIGLSIGDFLELAGEDPRFEGVPIQLLMIFLEEAELKAGFYAKAALSAMAYANFVVTGSAVGQTNGAGPGFTIAAGAGAGLKAGAGFQVFANVGIASFSRLVGRSVDVLVDASLGRIVDSIPSSDAATRQTVWAARTPAKVALRVAYELGEHLAVRNAQHSAGGQDDVALRVLQVTLEELQRGCLEAFLQSAVTTVSATLLDLQQSSLSVWTASRAERQALAAKLRSAPDEPLGAAALPFWMDVVQLTLSLASRFTAADPTLRKTCAVLWAAAQLADVAARRATRAEASVSLIGVPPRSARAPFAGTLDDLPPPPIDGEIRARLQHLGTPVSGALDYAHLVLYLSDQTLIDALRQHNPALVAFLSDLVGPFAPDVTALVRLVLQNGAAFPVPGTTGHDPTAALDALSGGVARFVSTRLDDAFRQRLEPVFGQHRDVATIFDEVLMPSLRFTIDVVFREASAWASSRTPTVLLTEALSSILLRVLGRSLVVTGDILLAEAQRNVSTLLQRAAHEAGRSNGLIDTLAAMPAVGLGAEEIGELIVDALEVGSEVFAPMPAEKRQRIRGLLYDAIDPLGGASSSEMMTRLNDSGLPNPETMDALARELGLYASERFVVFVEGLILKIIARQIAAWREVLDAVVEVVAGWISDLEEGLRILAERIEEIGAAVAALVEEIERRLVEAGGAVHDLLDSFSEARARDEFVDQVAQEVSSRAIGVLEENWIYRNAVPPGIRSDIRATVRSIVRSGLRNEALDHVLEAIGVLGDEIDEIIDDARALDRSQPVGPQLRELVLGRVIDAVDDQFGTVRIDIRFGVHWNAFGLRVDKTIDLGSIRVPLGAVTDAIRPMINGLAVFDDAIDAMANALGALFAAEAEAAHLEAERAAVAAEQEKTAIHIRDMQPGPKRVTIDRPVSMQTVPGDAAVVIRFSGFTTAILEQDASTPSRVHAVLNGTAIDLRSFHVDAADGPAAIIGSRGALPASAILARTRLSAGHAGSGAKAARLGRQTTARRNERKAAPALGSAALRGGALPDLRPNQADGFSLSGTLPQPLLRPGVNTLLVEVIAGRSLRVHHSVGFVVVPAAPAAPRRNRDKPARGGRLAGTALPEGTAASPATIDYALARERKAAAAALARTLATPRTPPLAQLAAVSPRIAERLKLPVIGRPVHPPRLILVARPKEGDYA